MEQVAPLYEDLKLWKSFKGWARARGRGLQKSQPDLLIPCQDESRINVKTKDHRNGAKSSL